MRMAWVWFAVGAITPAWAVAVGADGWLLAAALALSTPALGPLIAIPLRPRSVFFHKGAMWIHVDRLIPGWARAQTWGPVVLYRPRGEITSIAVSIETLAHEDKHVSQWSRLGPLFPLAYGVGSAVASISGGHYYRDNWFEHDARAEAIAARDAYLRASRNGEASHVE